MQAVDLPLTVALLLHLTNDRRPLPSIDVVLPHDDPLRHTVKGLDGLLNGKLLNQYPVSGALAEKPDKLYLGGNLGYPFAGNIYDFKVMPFSKESVQKLLPAGGNATPDPASLMPVKTIKYPALNLADPQGTVKVYDFKKFSPQPDSAKNGWLFRDNMHFVVPWAGVLNAALAPDSVPLTYDPALKGEYDVYAGVRTYTGATSIIVTLGNDN